MEHRHIPASKDGSIPSAKTRFWRGEDNFLEEKWYGRCVVSWFARRNIGSYCDAQLQAQRMCHT